MSLADTIVGKFLFQYENPQEAKEGIAQVFCEVSGRTLSESRVKIALLATQ